MRRLPSRRTQRALRACPRNLIGSILAGGALAWATVTPAAAAPSSNAPQDVFEYTDPGGTTHLTNVPDRDAAHPDLKLLVRAERTALLEGATGTAPRPLPAALREWVAEAARAEHLDPALILAVMSAESAYNPAAVSRKGAIGLMQLMPETATLYGVADSADAHANIRAGAKHLRRLIDQFHGDLSLALAAYNAGSNAVERFHNTIPPYAETQSYVPRVLGLYRQVGASLDGTLGRGAD